MYTVTIQYSRPVTLGSINEVRKYLRSKFSGQVRKCRACTWESNNIFVWDSQTGREADVKKIVESNHAAN